MALPAYLFLTDTLGNSIRGGSDAKDREGAIELINMAHHIDLPINMASASASANRVHRPVTLTKHVDCSSTYLLKAICQKERLKSALIKCYRINDAGLEEEFFNIFMEDVLVSHITPSLSSVGGSGLPSETFSLVYKNITWRYLDGNLCFTDNICH